ncbi:MAG: hypothetical protein ABWY80_05975 [Acidimicrobiia bacterium]
MATVREENELRLNIVEPGFSVREVVPPGGPNPPESFFDPFFCFAEDDGSVVIMDIGGQPEPGWNPNQGHGSIWRLHPDDRLTPIVPLGAIGMGCILPPVKVAPPSFKPYGGELVFCGQALPGRSGAKAPHAVYHVPYEGGTPGLVSLIPNSGGSVAFGVPGALVGNTFGPEGSEHEGHVFFSSLMNCTVYRVREGEAEPWLICDPEHIGRTIMPYGVFFDDDGGMVLYGKEGTSYTEAAGTGSELRLWRVSNGTVADDPIEGLDEAAAFSMLANNSVAPEGFGPFGGQSFSTTQGSANLMHVTMMPTGALPYDSTIVRVDAEGTPHVFADQLQSGAPTCMFVGDRMLVSRIGKSYSTGDYHETDGAIYEITYTG